MSEYWKSLPKKYCDVCKVWYQDNKASIQHHEQGWKHKTNVQKKLNELRKRGSDTQKEEDKYKLQMLKIEAAALGSFQKDVAADPSLARELSSTPSLVSQLPSTSSSEVSTSHLKGRFGEELIAEESQTLVRGREQALETIAKKLEKKSKWLERKTAEGEVFYWNRETFESTRNKPKSGFVPLSEQDQSDQVVTDDDGNVVRWESYIPKPYSSWQEVKSESEIEGNIVDLQLPKGHNLYDLPKKEESEVREVKVDKVEKTEFAEKTLEKPLSSKTDVVFKKRKLNDSARRNVRQRDE